MLDNAKIALTSTVGRHVLKAQKYSPQVLFGIGVVGTVTTAVLASRATLKLHDVLDEHDKNMVMAETLQHRDYSETDRKRDKVFIKTKTATTVVKLYAPAVVVGTLSIAALTGSHVILSRRNAAITAAYATVDKTFREYRKRVVDEYGEDKDRELRFGTETVKEKVVNKDGKTETVEKKKIKVDGDRSMYARLFSRQTSSSWEEVPEYNLMFLRAQQDYANKKLQQDGHVTLNDIHDALGLERTREGMVVGWVKNSKNGDNYIDFGIYDEDRIGDLHNFMTDKDGSIWLDFNVDGLIYNQI